MCSQHLRQSLNVLVNLVDKEEHFKWQWNKCVDRKLRSVTNDGTVSDAENDTDDDDDSQ